MTGFKWGAKIVGLILFGVAVLWEGYYQVPAGYQGILIQQGAVSGSFSAGPHFVTPFLQRVELMEIRTQKEEAQAAAASRDLQNVSTQVAINYHVDPAQASILYKNVGPSFAARIIDPAVQETVKAVVARYSAEELIRQRSTVKSELDAGLTQRLLPYSIVIENGGVSLKDFQFSEDFNKSIEQKQVAQQTAEKAKYDLQKAEVEAQTAITTAKGEAEANRIKAQALSNQGGAKVLAREWIQKWDGHLPTVSSTGSQILDLRDLAGDVKGAAQ